MSKQHVEERRARLHDCMMSVVRDAPCRKWGKCIYPDQCEEVENEIHRLIEKFFEWQERAMCILANIALGDEPDDKRIYKALKLLEAIRDFGKEVIDE